jgi:hypothetical protein
MKMAAQKSVSERPEAVDPLDLDLYAIIFPKGASGLKILNHHCQLSTVCPAFC